MSATTAPAPDLSGPWQLSPQVSLRDEAFGALAYHHGTRRLVFLKSRDLVQLVRRIEEFDSIGAALAELVAPSQRPRYEAALANLVRSEILSGR